LLGAVRKDEFDVDLVSGASIGLLRTPHPRQIIPEIHLCNILGLLSQRPLVWRLRFRMKKERASWRIWIQFVAALIHEVENLADLFLLQSLTGCAGVAHPQRTVASSVQISKEDGNIGRSGPVKVESPLEVMVIPFRILLEVPHQLVPSVMARVVLVGWSHDDAEFQQEDVQDDTVIVYGLLYALSYLVTGVETKDKFLAGARKRRLKHPGSVCLSSVKW